jgi:hypothetical protein
MIRCLDAYDLGYKGSVILMHELDEFVLRFPVVDPDDGVRHDLILSATPIVELRDGRDYRVGVFDDAAA